MKTKHNKIFNIRTHNEFELEALDTFHYQYHNVLVYKKFVDFLNITPSHINSIEKIPFLPISMFKHHKILSQTMGADIIFKSSGTTKTQRSTHHIHSLDYYENHLDQDSNIFMALLPIM